MSECCSSNDTIHSLTVHENSTLEFPLYSFEQKIGCSIENSHFFRTFHDFPEITEESTNNFLRSVKVFGLNLFWGENFLDESFLD